jgi:hypothetical protein
MYDLEFMKKTDKTLNCFDQPSDGSPLYLYSDVSHQPRLPEIDCQQSSTTANIFSGGILKESEEKKKIGKRNAFVQIMFEEELKKKKSKGGGV